MKEGALVELQSGQNVSFTNYRGTLLVLVMQGETVVGRLRPPTKFTPDTPREILKEWLATAKK